jgi:hypothetical protein
LENLPVSKKNNARRKRHSVSDSALKNSQRVARFFKLKPLPQQYVPGQKLMKIQIRDGLQDLRAEFFTC